MQPFHVRCAFQKGIIKDYESMLNQKEDPSSDECFLFCCKHQEIGIRELKLGGRKRLMEGPSIMANDTKKRSGKAARKKLINDGDCTEESEKEDDDDGECVHKRKPKAKAPKAPILNPELAPPLLPSLPIFGIAEEFKGASQKPAMKSKKTGKAQSTAKLASLPPPIIPNLAQAPAA